MEAITNTMAFVFGLLVTIIGIVLQFASDKTTSQVSTLVRLFFARNTR
jgi:hypothetical protein